MTATSELQKLVASLIEAKKKAEEAGDALKEANERVRKLLQVDIPLAMAETGFSSVKLADGTQIEVKHEAYASIKPENRDAAFKWLEEHGHGGLIRTQAEIDFGKGEEALAEAFQEYCARNNLNYAIEKGVHPQTLKAFIREQMAEGKDIPLELFGAVYVQEAKISKAKFKLGE